MLLPDTKPPFRFWRFFFSPNGRVSRKAIWYFVVPIHATFYVASRIITENLEAAIGNNLMNSPWLYGNTLIGLFALVSLWPTFVIVAKRLHDVGWSAFLGIAPFALILVGFTDSLMTLRSHVVSTEFSLLNVLMLILNYGNLALIALLGFLPGAKGSNRFGLPVGSFPPEPAEHF